jgi:hypothetical protein
MDEIINKIFKLIGNSSPNKPHSFRDSGKYEYTLSQIGKELEKTSPNLSAIKKHKETFQQEANALLTSIKESSEKTMLPSQYILKNAINSGPNGSIVLYKYWTGEDIDIQNSPKIEILKWLLNIGSPPNLLTIAKEFSSVQTVLYSRLDDVSKRTLRYQEYILKKDKQWNKEDTTETLTVLNQIVRGIEISTELFGERIKINRTDFKALPPYIRKNILRNKETSKILLEPILLNEIWANPLKWKETPEATALKAKKDAEAHTKSLSKKALTCIQSRDLSNYILSSFLQSKYSLEYKERILSAFKTNTAKTLDWYMSRLDKSIPKEYSHGQNKWDKNSLSILEFYSNAIGNRVPFLSPSYCASVTTEPAQEARR